MRSLQASLVALTLAAGAACATEAWARDIPAGGLTVDEAADWVRGAGLPAEIATTDKGDRYIKSVQSGASFELDFYDCGKDGRCGSLQFQTSFQRPGGFSIDKINQWNGEQRYASAFLDGQHSAFLHYDVSLAPGRTYEGLTDDFAVWRNDVVRFRTFMAN